MISSGFFAATRRITSLASGSPGTMVTACLSNLAMTPSRIVLRRGPRGRQHLGLRIARRLVPGCLRIEGKTEAVAYSHREGLGPTSFSLGKQVSGRNRVTTFPVGLILRILPRRSSHPQHVILAHLRAMHEEEPPLSLSIETGKRQAHHADFRIANHRHAAKGFESL